MRFRLGVSTGVGAGSTKPRLLRTFASGLAVGLFSTNILSATEYKVDDTVSDGYLNLRSGPGVNYSVVVEIPQGTPGLDLQECGDSTPWCRVKWSGYEGWVSSQYISPVDKEVYVSSGDKIAKAGGIRFRIFAQG